MSVPTFLFIQFSYCMKGNEYMRKDIREAVYIMKMNHEKINWAKLARQYDCDYRTVKKAYKERDSDKKPRKSRVVKKKTDGFESIIEEKYIKFDAPAIEVFNVLKNSYGYKGSYSTIKAYTHNLKKNKQNEVTMRFETLPGQQCQIDWKEDLTLVSRNGEVFNINIFLAILGYSRMKYIKLTLDRNQPTLFECLTNTIKYYGGTPSMFLFDNMKTVADQSRSQFDNVVYNERFYEFSKDAGFIPKSCMAYRPQTKGKVEVVAKIMNRLKAYNNEFNTLDELNNIVIKLNEEINNEIQQTTLEKPIDRFQKEKEYLNPEPKYDILEAYYLEKEIVRKVPKDCLITYQNHKYSVQPAFAGKTVTIHAQNDILYIYYNKTLISSHKISDKLINYNETDYRLLAKHSLIKEELIERICEDNLKLFDKI